jgi:hypothetical protein
VSFLAELRSALATNRIRGALADRIVAELADHLACDPDARLGSPTEIAERFAAELRVVRTRRATLVTFAALAVCAIEVIVVGSARAGQAGGSPLAGLGIFAFGQIAFVAGMLALIRTVRGGTTGDLRLAQRRALIAVIAGAATCACVAVQTTPFALLPLIALLPALRASLRAAAVTPAAPAPGLRADVPVPLPIFGAIAVALVLAQGIVGEHSVVEGLVRAGIEAAGLAAGVVLLGRPLGLRN